MNIIETSIKTWSAITSRLNSAGNYIPQLFLRGILFWEFWEAGILKYEGGSEGNWFSSIHDSFPFPFDTIDPTISWYMSMWGELTGALLIFFGLFTRFAAFSLIIITVVATSAVHWPQSWDSLSELWKGFAITNDGYGNYKLPLLYVVMLLPLLFSGAGKFSVDYLVTNLTKFTDNDSKTDDLSTWGLILLIFAVIFIYLIPVFAIPLFILAVILIGLNLYLVPK